MRVSSASPQFGHVVREAIICFLAGDESKMLAHAHSNS